MTEWMHPAWPFLIGAVLAGLAPGAARRIVVLVAPAVGVTLAWLLPQGAQLQATVMGHDLLWLRADALARPFTIIFALLGGLGLLYGWSGSRRLHTAGLTATGAALGIALAGDWVTFYLAWETLAVASFVLIKDGASPRASAAAYRYLLMHILGGACLLAGVSVHLGGGGGGLVAGPVAGSAWALILVAFAINAATPPLHAWLTDAYPESSPAGAVLLSAFATKAAVYALARVFPGVEALVWVGAMMTLYGVVFAVLENDIRRLLGYHIVSQVGYMVTGVGLGTSLAISGTVAHAFSHILYKGLLFMATGAVVQATGRRRLTDLGGLAAAMPATLALYMIGALSISGAPLLNGFISKSLVVAAAEASHRDVVAALLTLASVGTFLSVGLKLPFFTFGGASSGATPSPVPKAALLAMGLTAALCFLSGVAPQMLYRLLPFAVAYRPYTTDHVLGAVQLLVGTALGFTLLLRLLKGKPTVTLDADRAYRALGRLVAGLGQRVARAADALEEWAIAGVTRPLHLPRVRALASMSYDALLAVLLLGAGIVVLGLFR
ncbi:MAG TPA: Na(+)/H(+) antiporter subunit D [Methylomirabilota bacterium]|nr:Na(+)/H(+) antiporter subunit D [Methylomirabilota bacterium]